MEDWKEYQYKFYEVSVDPNNYHYISSTIDNENNNEFIIYRNELLLNTILNLKCINKYKDYLDLYLKGYNQQKSAQILKVHQSKISRTINSMLKEIKNELNINHKDLLNEFNLKTQNNKNNNKYLYKYNGVYYNNRTDINKKYRVKINNRTYGVYYTEDDAALAYNYIAEKLGLSDRNNVSGILSKKARDKLDKIFLTQSRKNK